MNRDEWIGLGTSVGAHLALVLLFALLTAGRPTPPTLGAVQLEIGAFAEGRPVQQSESASQEAEAQPSEAPPEDSQRPSASNEGASSDEESEPDAVPAEGTPVDLPEQEKAQGEEPPPEEPPSKPKKDAPPAQASSKETKPPAESSAAAEERASQEAAAQRANEGGEQTGEATGAASGEEGTGDDEDKAAPFNIEGLNRTRLYGAMPQYTEKVNATIKVEITVSPQGEVIGQRLLRKANPSLERSVMEALREWRFNRLPSGAPQKPQTGVVTFRFRLE